jgi:hypothetical protein
MGVIMNKQFEDLMYEAGLTAQGCWDSFDAYDKDAIERFAVLIVQKCLEKVDQVAAECELVPSREILAIGAHMVGVRIAMHFEL